MHIGRITTYILPTLLFVLLVSLALLPRIALGADTPTYQPLTAIPGVSTEGKTSLATYLKSLFALAVAVAAMLAVVKIALGGFQYMMSDVITTKESAKKNITGALLGLGIILAAVTILVTINSNLVKLDFLTGASSVNTESSGAKYKTEVVETKTIDTDNKSAGDLFNKKCVDGGGGNFTSFIRRKVADDKEVFELSCNRKVPI